MGVLEDKMWKSVLCNLFGHKNIYSKNRYGISGRCKRCGKRTWISYKKLSKIIGEPPDPIVPMPDLIKTIMKWYNLYKRMEE
jgi:hypothetical protein